MVGRVRLAARERAVEDEAGLRVCVVYEVLERAAREVFEERFVVAGQRILRRLRGRDRATVCAPLRNGRGVRARRSGEKD